MVDKALERTPIIVVLGHVDHGKTTLLDSIRETSVQQQEPGGITQHISASVVSWKKQDLTFIDTPGHEVFNLMRSTGGKIADLALLIIAADEGVRKQTKESLDIIKENKLKYIVVINKIDKEGADVTKIKNELSAEKVYLEGMGGDIPVVEISAKKKTNIDKLLDLMLLYLEVENVLAPQKAKLPDYVKKEDVLGYGLTLDGSISKSRGQMGLFVLKQGQVSPQNYIVVNDQFSKTVRLTDIHDKPQKEIKAGYPFSLACLSLDPVAGTEFFIVADKEKAELYTELYQKQLQKPEEETEFDQEKFLDDLFDETEEHTFNIILKADTQSTLDSIKKICKQFSTDELKVKVVGQDLGDITHKDIDEAEVLKAEILGFNVKASSQQVQKYNKNKGIKIQTFRTVYDLMEYLSEVMVKVKEEKAPQIKPATGVLLVKKVFTLSNNAIVAGGLVKEGEIKKGQSYRVKNDRDEIVATGQIKSLKVQKDEVNKVEQGSECGILLEGQVEVEKGWIIEVY